MTELNSAQLIGLDWGSTVLRACLIGQGAQILGQRTGPLGASMMKTAADYAQTMDDMAGAWLAHRPDLPVLACGMVGSKHGWQEVPYAECPSSPTTLAQQLTRVGAHPVHIVPGLICHPDNAAPDVMRGEETQVIGALHECPELIASSCIVMPGTHSKWVTIAHGKVTNFSTYLTGELFAVLREHSILGRLMPAMAHNAAEQPDHSFSLPTFLAGVDAARDGQGRGLTHQLFAVRTLGLTEKIPAQYLADYLSGLLIGHEIDAGLGQNGNTGNTALALVGEPRICELYSLALERFGRKEDQRLSNTASAGLWCLAQACGLIETAGATKPGGAA